LANYLKSASKLFYASKFQILNVVLRGLTLASKFLLVILLAKMLSPKQIGEYGLLTATISYSLYLVGFDFYTYSTREIVSSIHSKWPQMIRDQIVFHLIMYVAIFPILLFIFVSEILDWKVIGWFYSLLVCEHISQESNRLLIALLRPIMASIVMFIRMGAWCYAVIWVMVYYPDFQSLGTVWFGWLTGGLVSVLLSCYALKSLPWQNIKGIPIQWLWIKKGIKTASYFFAGTIALRGIFTLDRYILKFYCGVADVGVYTFFMGIANAMQSFVDAGVIVFIYPKMVKAYRNNNNVEFRKELKNLSMGILLSVAILFSCAAICMYPLLNYIGKESYINSMPVFWVLMAAISVSCIGMIPHYVLYAKKKDLSILYVNLICFCLFLVCSFFVVKSYEVIGMAYLILFVFVSMLIMKILAITI
jgi:O-antigen/teichoic acid export membrane protein